MSRTSRSSRHAPLVGALALAILSASVSGSEPGRSRPSAAPPRSASSEATYLAGRGHADGIDVSAWQGRVIWWRVKRDGVDFAIAKATEGYGWVDRQYERNRAMAAVRGVVFTAYHYARPDRSRGDARREADWFVRHADLRGRDLVPALDLEATGGLSRKQLRRWTLTWLRRVERRIGVKPMIYTSPGFWASAVGDTRAVARRGYRFVWVAHWGTFRPRVPAARWDRHGWTFWQWTSRGRVDGIRGFVDRDWFNGSRRELRDLTIRQQRRR